MMIRRLTVSLLLMVPLVVSPAWATDHAAETAGHAAQASGHSVMSGLHALAASGKVTLNVSAVPLIAAGSVGAASGKMGRDLMKATHEPIGAPLPISDEAVSAGPPPDAALQKTKP